MEKNLDIIWNLTRVCPYSCKICCVNAIYAKDPKKQIEARKGQIRIGREIEYSKNLEILSKIKEYSNNISIDFSGGDPLIFEENLILIDTASKLFDKEKIRVSGTGYDINNSKVNLLKKIGGIEFTVDKPPYEEDIIRTKEYNQNSIESLEKCLSEGVNCGVSTVIRKDNIYNQTYKRLFTFLKKYSLNVLHLLRLHPAGRAEKYRELIPKKEDYNLFFAQLDDNKGKGLHHSFRGECQAGKDMIGILPNGDVLSCCWALNRKGNPINHQFVLGNLIKQNLREILNSEKALFWKENKYTGCMTDLHLNKYGN